MKHHTLSVLTTIALLTSFNAQAQDNTSPSITMSSYAANKYLAFGTGSVLTKDSVAQTDLFVSFKSGLYVDLWNSRSLTGKWNDGSFGNEVDYGAGWKGSVAKSLILNVGVTYFDEPRAFTLGAGDILYPHAFLTKEFRLLSVTVGYEDYIAMPGSGFKGGSLVSLGASWSRSFGKASLHASFTGVYDTGTIGTSHGFIARGCAGADWSQNDRLTLNVLGVNWFVPVTPHDKRVSNAMVFTGLTFKIK